MELESYSTVPPAYPYAQACVNGIFRARVSAIYLHCLTYAYAHELSPILLVVAVYRRIPQNILISTVENFEKAMSARKWSSI